MGNSHTGPLPRPSKYLDQTEANLGRAFDASLERDGPHMTLDESGALFDREGPETAAPTSFGGVYRATVVNADDPLLARRLQVEVPSVSAGPGPWALPALPPGWDGELPAVGAGVWVMFEGGDRELPVWLGSRS